MNIEFILNCCIESSCGNYEEIMIHLTLQVTAVSTTHSDAIKFLRFSDKNFLKPQRVAAGLGYRLLKINSNTTI